MPWSTWTFNADAFQLIRFAVQVYTVIHIIVFCFTDIAARHHYTNDIITALYVNPMIWFLLEAYYPDPDNFTTYNIPDDLVTTAFGETNPVYFADKHAIEA